MSVRGSVSIWVCGHANVSACEYILVLDSTDFSSPTRYELYRNALIDLLQPKRKHPPPLDVKMDTDGRVCVEGGMVIDVADAKELGQCFSEVREWARRDEGCGIGSGE